MLLPAVLTRDMTRTIRAGSGQFHAHWFLGAWPAHASKLGQSRLRLEGAGSKVACVHQHRGVGWYGWQGHRCYCCRVNCAACASLARQSYWLAGRCGCVV